MELCRGWPRGGRGPRVYARLKRSPPAVRALGRDGSGVPVVDSRDLQQFPRRALRNDGPDIPVLVCRGLKRFPGRALGKGFAEGMTWQSGGLYGRMVGGIGAGV